MLMDSRYDVAVPSKEVSQTRKTDSSIPSHHDWRDEGVLNDVKDQRGCGSCWAFAVVASVEAAWAIAGNGLESLSEQELIDCGAGDCNGGWIYDAYDTIINKGGLMTEEDYPYTAHNAVNGCQYEDDKNAASISGYQALPQMSPSADSVYENGPHVIKLYANGNFMNYHSGIFNDTTCPQNAYNHAVVVVGYDIDDEYWVVRNSWGS